VWLNTRKKLNGQTELDGKWEVGLTEISFPFDFDKLLEGECYFVINNPEYDEATLNLHLLRDTMLRFLRTICRIARLTGASNSLCDIATSCAYTGFL